MGEERKDSKKPFWRWPLRNIVYTPEVVEEIKNEHGVVVRGTTRDEMNEMLREQGEQSGHTNQIRGGWRKRKNNSHVKPDKVRDGHVPQGKRKIDN